MIGQYWSRDLNTGLWLVNTDHSTWILVSDWSILVTWSEYWPVIGQYRSRDLNTVPSFVDKDHVTIILDSDWMIKIMWLEYWTRIGQYLPFWPSVIIPQYIFIFHIADGSTGARASGRTGTLITRAGTASDWSQYWPQYWPLIGRWSEERESGPGRRSLDRELTSASANSSFSRKISASAAPGGASTATAGIDKNLHFPIIQKNLSEFPPLRPSFLINALPTSN